jgi:hypothetical protein
LFFKYSSDLYYLGANNPCFSCNVNSTVVEICSQVMILVFLLKFLYVDEARFTTILSRSARIGQTTVENVERRHTVSGRSASTLCERISVTGMCLIIFLVSFYVAVESRWQAGTTNEEAYRRTWNGGTVRVQCFICSIQILFLVRYNK